MLQNKYNILLVDSTSEVFEFLLDILPGEHYNIVLNFHYKEALKNIKTNYFDLLVIEASPKLINQRCEVFSNFKKRFTHSKILCMGEPLTPDLAVECMRNGADDVIDKSNYRLTMGERLNHLIKQSHPDEKVLNKFKLEHNYARPEHVMIGKNSAINDLKKKINKIITYEPDIVLIEGESGVGKDLLAKIIYEKSTRRHHPFVQVNCAAFPETLIDSELFGYEKGSFTGANRTMPGKFEIANRGILFLDEISEMPLNFQAKLLQVLDSKTFYRIGGKNIIHVDLMIIAASNKNLVELVKKGQFREDIFFRISKATLKIPPLRERREDITALVNHFLDQWNCKCHRNVKVPQVTMKKMLEYSYPGNVRELKHTLENALIFCRDGKLEPEDIHFSFDDSYCPDQDIDRDSLIIVLKQHGCNISKAARSIGYSREGLSKKLKRMGIDKTNL